MHQMFSISNLLLRTVVTLICIQAIIINHDVTLPYRTCLNTVLQSKQAFFYVVDFNTNPLVPLLIHLLHDASIKTVFLTDPENLAFLSTSSHTKNVIFSLENIGEMMSLILDSASKQTRLEIYSIFNETRQQGPKKLSQTVNIEGGKNQNQTQFCIKVEGMLLDPGMKVCDEEVNMEWKDLEDTSMLTDAIFNFTRGLYNHNIWNSNNNLIFMLDKFSQYQMSHNESNVPSNKRPQNSTVGGSKTVIDDRQEILVFCFKFIWRFFRGLKTVICYRESCKRYDPFRKEIISYNGAEFESYFDFSWSDMQNKTVPFLLDYGTDAAIEYTLWVYWENFAVEILEHLQTVLNCTVEQKSLIFLRGYFPEIFDDYQFDIGQKSGSICIW
ncbi:unnamed protein product [Bemisia tabaci]|uniref:Ionotropic receptor n=1 Tax=Bemisia tabaci TaxID=7038 RepID=A0A9P0A2X1_BEMTA|nr:unnamed protein product [Bemisia tabaci]